MRGNLTTRSPSFHSFTPRPAATTVPETSCPKICGDGTKPCWIFLISVPQMPQAATRIRTSPSEIVGTGTCSTTTRPAPRYTPARICFSAGAAENGASSWAVMGLMCTKSLRRLPNEVPHGGSPDGPYSDPEKGRATRLLGGSDGRSARAPATTLGADRKSTRLNSSHVRISYAVFCLKKKKKKNKTTEA